MKHRFLRIACLLLAAAVMLGCAAALVACGETPAPPTVPSVDFFKDGALIEGKTYVIVCKDGDNGAKKMANELNNVLRGVLGDRLEVKTDAEPVTQYEILVGETNRELSKKLIADINKKNEADFVWGYYVEGSTLAIYARTPETWSADLLTDSAWTRCLDYIRSTLIRNGTMSLKSNLRLIRTVTEAEHNEELAAIEEQRLQEELKAQQERLEAQQKEVDKLLPLLSSEFDISDFYGSDIRYSWDMVRAEVERSEDNRYAVNYNWTELYDMTADQAKAGYKTPSVTPTVGQHPRLLFTQDDIPALKALLKSAKDENHELNSAYKAFIARVEADVDGILEPIVYKSPESTKQDDNMRYNSNFSAHTLATIQAKAFWYVVTGEKLYGYQAIYAMKNYLKTLDIGFYDSDQCRYYGYTAYMGALVYDWCYDLMSEDDKAQLALGLQNKCFVGFSSLPDGSPNSSGDGKGTGTKTEVGFPPTIGTGPVEGHGTEMTILRDYLSVAIAIYDEEPSWYNLIGGRMFDEYIPIRNYYYAAGIYPEGTSTYAPFRYLADMYSAWMLTSTLGANPYDDTMQQVVYSFAAHECGDNGLFSTGDGNGNILRNSNTMGSCLITSYLYKDSTMRAVAAWGGMFNPQMNGNAAGVANLTVTEVLLLSSNGVKTGEDRHEGMPLITYNDGYYQQIIARSSWDTDAPVVLMRGASATTIGHSHQASGEFQIYYKGMLAGDDGVYDNYGSAHHLYYHKATIAHSALLVYNPAKKMTEGGYYSGGQPKLSSTKDIKEFMTSDYFKTGEVTGVKYANGDSGTPKYVYYANDLTPAYATNIVDYVGRSMLTTFTGDETYPMILFVFDRIDVPKTDYTKTFVLQSAKQPVIDEDEMTAVIDNGSGKLVLKNLIGGGSIAAYGGETGDAAQRYWISTQNKNLPSFGGLSSGAGGNGTGGNTNGHMWGKVEVRTEAGNKSDVMMNVLYVTDSETTDMPTMKGLGGIDDGYVGAVALNQVAVFATETGTDYRETELTVTGVTGVGRMDFYVGGLAEGKWQVKVGSDVVGTFDVADGEHMITFTARAGKLTITPVS